VPHHPERHRTVRRARRYSGRAAAGLGAVVASTLVAAAAAASVPVPTTDDPPTYTRFLPVADPGTGAADYFEPFWYDTSGRQIQAHGGQVVTATSDELGVSSDDVTSRTEGGRTVYYWYGEDRSNGYYDTPGVAAYRSTDLLNWTFEGDVLRTVSTKAELTQPYFADLYGTVRADGTTDTTKVDQVFRYLNTDPYEADGTTAQVAAIVERPKVLYDAKTRQWVMWWHSDGNSTPGGGMYVRSLAGVAVADSPTGPFRMVGAYRLPNETTYASSCTKDADPGGSRDMTVYQDDDGAAYLVYSSENNWSLYVAKLDDSYTNVVRTTSVDTTGAMYSEDGTYPYVLADGKGGAPVEHRDFTVVAHCDMLEAPAMFKHDGRYYIVASGATGWAPNQQTYYTADDLLGTWKRGLLADDDAEHTWFTKLRAGDDGVLSVGDARSSTFGSQSTNVLALDAAKGEFVYMGDRWDAGEPDSTYVWLPLTFGEDGKLELRNPAAEDPARWADGWDASYWDDHGAGGAIWKVTDDRLPATLRTDEDLSTVLPTSVAVSVHGRTTDVPVTWDRTSFMIPGKQTLTGTLAGDADFTPGRTFTRTVTVAAHGRYDIAPEATASASSRTDLAATTNDGSTAKGWDDWVAGGAYPLKSWLAYTWTEPRRTTSVVVHTYQDGPTATWPSHVGVEYQDADGAWVTTSVAADVSQDASKGAPVVTLDTSALPATTAIRVDLTTATTTWQSVSEVEVLGYAADDGTSTGCDTPGVRAPWLASPGAATGVTFCQDADQDGGAAFRISDANNGAWTSRDQLSVAYRPSALPVGASITTHVAALDAGGVTDPRAGLVVRDDLSDAGRGKAAGYAVLATSPSGAYLQYDADGDGFLDSQTDTVAAAAGPVRLRLERTSADEVTGYYRASDDDAWQVVGTAPLTGAAAGALDAGVMATANSPTGRTVTATLVGTAVSKAAAPKAPRLTFRSPGEGDTLSGKVTVKVRLQGEDLVAYNLRVDSAGLQYVWHPEPGVEKFVLDTGTLTAGRHTLLATATDAAGHKTTVTEDVVVG